MTTTETRVNKHAAVFQHQPCNVHGSQLHLREILHQLKFKYKTFTFNVIVISFFSGEELLNARGSNYL